MNKLNVNEKWVADLVCQLNSRFTKENLLDQADLFATGALDSLSLFELIQIFEEKLNILFDFNDLNVENFSNLKSICELLHKKYLTDE